MRLSPWFGSKFSGFTSAAKGVVACVDGSTSVRVPAKVAESADGVVKARNVEVAVVNDKVNGAASPFPARSLAPVVMVTVYAVFPARAVVGANVAVRLEAL